MRDILGKQKPYTYFGVQWLIHIQGEYPKYFKIFIVGKFFSHIIYVSMKKGEPEISILHLKEETK